MVTSLGRIFRHLLTPPWSLERHFPRALLERVEKRIRDSEQRHQGQIRFAIEPALEFGGLVRNMAARERALDVFSQLRVWDTEQNNGVLIYLLLADRDVEIVADRGIDRFVSADGWEAICKGMEAHFRRHAFEEGVLYGIAEVEKHLSQFYPGRSATNELEDRPAILR